MSTTQIHRTGIAPWKWILGSVIVAIPLLLGIGLTRDPSFIPSAVVGKTMPPFKLPLLEEPGELDSQSMAGKPYVINFWASWCTSCRIEHPLLLELGREALTDDGYSIVGINYRDSADAAKRYLAAEGAFPYRSAVDLRGRTGIDFGVYGMPETFFISAEGEVVARHVGPLTREAVDQNLALLGIEQ